MFSSESKYNPGTLKKQNSSTNKEPLVKNFCPLLSALAAKNKPDIEKGREKAQGYWLTKPNWEMEAGIDGGEEQERVWGDGGVCGCLYTSFSQVESVCRFQIWCSPKVLNWWQTSSKLPELFHSKVD